jgi:hypothetical protein
MSRLLIIIGAILAIAASLFISGETLANGRNLTEAQQEQAIDWENQEVTPDGTKVDFNTEFTSLCYGDRTYFIDGEFIITADIPLPSRY